MQLGPKRRPIDRLSVITVGLVLLLGASLGFVVGYKYNKPKTKTTTAAASAAVATRKRTPAQQARTKAIVTCMAAKGVKYASKTPNISQPPPGVAYNTYSSAISACRTSVAATQKQAAARQRLIRALIVNCMAKYGVRYPSGTTNISAPPPGVAVGPFQDKLAACRNSVAPTKPSS